MSHDQPPTPGPSSTPTPTPDGGDGAGAPIARPWWSQGPRAVVGGLLMGFANVVPGISGGAMLLIVGVYQAFIHAVAELTTLRWKIRSFVLLGFIALGAGTSILLTAGPIKEIVLTHRWQAFSLFIGMRLGAIPTVLKLARPMTPRTWAGVAAGLIITAALGVFQYAGGGSAVGDSTPFSKFLGGLVGASATILPGMDGSYFLLLMGEYVPILAAVDGFKDALLAGNVQGAIDQIVILLPVAAGVALGLGGLSIALRWLLTHHQSLVAGVLLGVLVGAVGGLWPFRRGVPPEPGEVVRGITVTAENAGTIDPEHWRMAFFSPSAVQIAGCLGLIALGVLISWGFSRLEPADPKA